MHPTGTSWRRLEAGDPRALANGAGIDVRSAGILAGRFAGILPAAFFTPAGSRRCPHASRLRRRWRTLIFFASMNDEPEYLICLQCETPTYQFEFENGKLATIVCTTCGNDDVTDFMTETELEESS